MGATELLKTLAGHGVTLQAKPGGGLSAHGDPAVIAQHREAIREHKAALLQLLAAAAAIVEALAAGIAKQHGIDPADALSLLDADDRQAIGTGSDPGRADAWRGYVALAVGRGDIRPAPAPDAGPVRCADCRHANPTDPPGLIDCAAGIPAPGACGPVRWWADDPHHCQEFTPSTEEPLK